MSNDIIKKDTVIDAHKFLQDFLGMFDTANRGGIHDFMEISIFNMLNDAIKKIDDYLQVGHKKVSGTEIMHIVIDAYQCVIDRMRRNLDGMDEVNFE